MTTRASVDGVCTKGSICASIFANKESTDPFRKARLLYFILALCRHWVSNVYDSPQSQSTDSTREENSILYLDCKAYTLETYTYALPEPTVALGNY